MSSAPLAAPVRLTVFIDYLCPFAYRGHQWLEEVKRQRPGSLEVEYRLFSLEQINSKNPDWKLWEQHDGYTGPDPERPSRFRALHAFWADAAAREQGPEACDRFRTALFDARHVDRVLLDDRAGIRRVAEAAGLDLARFDRDFADRARLERLRADHECATGVHGAFGVPTLVFPGGESAYIKLSEVPRGEEAVRLFDDLAHDIVNRPYLVEVKRPVRP